MSYEKEIFKRTYGCEIERNPISGAIKILNFPSYPQKRRKAMKLFTDLERCQLLEEEIKFPANIRYFNEERVGDEVNLCLDFHFHGISEIIRERKLDPRKKNFFKAEIYYPNRSSKYPNLIVHFFEFDDMGMFDFENQYDFLDFAFVRYNTKQFTSKRINSLREIGLNLKEIIYIPAMRLEPVKFGVNGELLPIRQFELAKTLTIEEVCDVCMDHNLPF